MDLLVQGKKKEKGSRLLSGMKSKKNKMHVPSQPLERHLELITILRTQMQVKRILCIMK